MEKSQNSVTKNEKISKYEPSPIAKRLFAGIMDAAVFIFVFLGLALWVFTPLSNPLFQYQDTVNIGRRYHLSSHLYLPQKINVKLLAQGPSELNIIIGVSSNDYEETIRSLYDALIK